MTAVYSSKDESEGSMEDMWTVPKNSNKKDTMDTQTAATKDQLLRRKQTLESKIQQYYDRGDEKKIAELEKERSAVMDSIERIDLDTKIKATREDMEQIEAEKALVAKQKRKLRAKMDRYTDKKDEKKLAKLEKERLTLEASVQRLETETQVKARMERYHQKLKEKNLAKLEKERLTMQNSLECLDLETSAQQLSTAKELLNESTNLLSTTLDDVDFGNNSDLSKDDDIFASTMGAIKSQKALEEQREKDTILAMKKKKLEKKKKQKKKLDKKKNKKGTPSSGGEVAEDQDHAKDSRVEAVEKLSTKKAAAEDLAIKVEQDNSSSSDKEIEKEEDDDDKKRTSLMEEAVNLVQSVEQDLANLETEEEVSATKGDPATKAGVVQEEEEEDKKNLSTNQDASFTFNSLNGSQSSTAEDPASFSNLGRASSSSLTDKLRHQPSPTKSKPSSYHTGMVSSSNRVRDLAAQFDASANRSFSSSFRVAEK